VRERLLHAHVRRVPFRKTIRLPLGERGRLAAFAGACSLFGCAFAAAPDGAESAAALDVPLPPAVPGVSSPARYAAVLPRRNPFDDGSTAAVHEPNAAVPVAAGVGNDAPDALLTPPAALRPLPPNAGAPSTPFSGDDPIADGATRTPRFASASHVDAVVTGPHAVALVTDAHGTRIVAAGDRIEGVSVSAIDADGVHLSDGRLLSLSKSAQGERSP
jgi:hypothetical protein